MGAISLPTRFYELHTVIVHFFSREQIKSWTMSKRKKPAQGWLFGNYETLLLYQRSINLTIKEIEEQLKRVKKGNDLIQRLQLKYQSLDNGLLSGSNQFTTRVKTSKTNTTEDKILKTLELKDEIVEQMQAIMDERFEVLNMINQLDDVVENLVLEMLYVNNLPMVKVCKDLDFSKIQIYRIKKKAIENLAKVKNANR